MVVQEDKIKVGIIGASGYTGLELIKMVHGHPRFALSYIANTQGGVTLSQLHPALEGVIAHEVEAASVEKANSCDLVFLALPHKTAFSFAKDLTTKVVDLSADYRLDQQTYEQYYCKHEDGENIKNFAYGLVEHNRQALKSATNASIPGCYPTVTLLGLLPFKNYLHPDSPIIVDAKSGVSGAGKKCTEKTMFCTVNDNSFAYGPLTHRHCPEIATKLGLPIEKINFVPQLIPVTRGMMSNIYITLKEKIDAKEFLQEYYKEEKFIRIKDDPVELKNVVGTHFCDIYVGQNGDLVFLNCAIDNLLRGASSQAVASANILCGLDENMGVPEIANLP